MLGDVDAQALVIRLEERVRDIRADIAELKTMQTETLNQVRAANGKASDALRLVAQVGLKANRLDRRVQKLEQGQHDDSIRRSVWKQIGAAVIVGVGAGAGLLEALSRLGVL